MEQEIQIRSDSGHVYRDLIVLTDKHETGVPARQKDPADKHIELDLSTIRYDCHTTKMKNGV